MTRLVAPGVTLACVGLVAVALWLAGAFAPWFTPDTQSYLDAASSAAPLGQMRLPLYGWLVGPMLGRPAEAVLPWLQGGVFGLAAWLLVRALVGFRLSQAACLAVGLALAFSNMMLLWARAALPELPAHACLLIAMALSVQIAAGRPAAGRIILYAAMTFLAGLLRPSLLLFTVLLPLLPLALPRRMAPGRVWRLAILMLLAGALPLAGLSALRGARTGSFAPVSFGGFQMSGIAALMLTPELAARLPAERQAEAAAIIAARVGLIASGAMPDLPTNSLGVRSFTTTAIFYFDILARHHDVLLWDGVLGLRRPDESWPAFDARMGGLTRAVIRAAPVPYAAWVLGATARLVGHALVLTPAFLLPFLAWLGLAALQRRLSPANAEDWRALAAICTLYCLGTGLPVVLLTFPASRYIDSAGLLISALPLFALCRALIPARLAVPALPDAG